jgi:CRP-like cAMP-binding protein
MPLSTVERIIFLRGADLFRDISGEDLVLIAQVCHEVFFPAGEIIIRQGDIGDCLYILVDGTLAIEIEGHGEVDRLSAKEVVGEMAIISRNPRSANCRALSDLTALRIDHDDFWDLLAEKPGLALGVIRVLSSRLYDRTRDLTEYKALNQQKLIVQ